MDLVDRLSTSELFQNLEWEDLAEIAALAREHRVVPGTILCRQADIGSTYFVIDSGQALIRRVDDRGFLRPVGVIREGDTFGTTSLLLAEPRDATVIASSDMRLWTIERDTFQTLLDDRPALRRMLVIPDTVVERKSYPNFSWLGPAERVVHYCHRHWIPLVLTLGAGTVGIALVLAVIVGVLRASGQAWDPTLWLLIPGAGWLIFVVWHWFDWVNDQVVVTTQRISYREQVALFYEERNEVPIDRVQNINVETTLMGRLFKYGTMIIQTASETGTMVLEQLPHPERVRDAIWDQTERTQATLHATERRLMADALVSQLGIEIDEDLPKPPIYREGIVEDGQPQISEDEGPAGVWIWLRDWIRSFDIVSRDAGPGVDQVVWRKHWIFLVRSAFVPAIVTLIVGTFAVLSWFGMPPTLASTASYRLIVMGLALGAVLWLLWAIVDWGNDQYIITRDRIADVEQRPFSMHSERREASLGVIQNVRFVIPHFWAALWGYGNVLVQTAGPGDFTFDRVPRPARVQAEIMRRLEAFRQQEREAEASQRRSEMAEWFAVYRDLSKRGADDDQFTDLSSHDIGADRGEPQS